MKKVLQFRVAACAIFLLCLTTVIAAPAQTFTSLLSFDGSDGAEPAYMSLVQGLDGNLYGTTAAGGIPGPGTIFRITARGTMTTLYDFCVLQDCTDGYGPDGGLVQGLDGNFYGTTFHGGIVNFNAGTVFKITPSGQLTTLHSFCALFNCTDGAGPYGGLVQAIDGNFYGTTSTTVFTITPGGTLTTLYTFCAQTGCTDGADPHAGLVQATDGNFYGTTAFGGASNSCNNNCGMVFKITSGGTLTTLHSFDVTDGAYPYAALVQATDGNLYGTTSAGGTYFGGTIFKITPAGELTTLYNFCATSGCLDGGGATAGLVQATDGNLYGTTDGGGANGDYGTVFKISSGGALTTLHSFDLTDGQYPEGGLVQVTNGNFYGATAYGGANGNGTVFSLSVGLGPFVEMLPAVGKVGSAVIILGNHLNNTTSVTFNGTAATFTVASPTEIRTTVPTGATSGKVQVTTLTGTLTSNVAFRVKQ